MGELDEKVAAIRERHADKSLYYPAFCYEDVGFLLKALDARDATIAELNAECHKIDEHYIAEMNKSDRLEAEASRLTRERDEAAARGAKAEREFRTDLLQQVNYLAGDKSCPCGAREDSIDTHPHVIGCAIGKLRRWHADAIAGDGAKG